MIKKFYIILASIVFHQSLVAQLNEDDFRAFSYQIAIDVYHHFWYNEYTDAYRLLTNWQGEYAKLNDSNKGKLIMFAQDNAYHMAKYYALTGYPTYALEQLELAIERGYRDYYKLSADPVFSSLYENEHFLRLLEKVQKVGDNLHILRSASPYSEYKADIPNFTYQNSSAADLKKLRSYYKLDSIAGSASDETQIINLMRWVHNSVRHDGFKVSPHQQNSLNFLAESNMNDAPLNCHAMSILLNEVYLAMGFASRYVMCFPKDTTDWEYHVINLVYSKNSNKWLYMDATNAAYVMNSKGELLSISEVRDHLINKKILILNPDANWNQDFTRTVNEYLWNYMAKNMYWFECPLNNEFDYETEKTGNTKTYIRLYPSGYSNKNYLKRETLFTNNEAEFWSYPKMLLSENSN